MSHKTHENLSRRERQIMNILYQNGQATALEVLENMPEPPSYSAVRAMLRVLEEKGHIHHKQQGPRYIFMPNVSRDKAKRSALKQLLQTFFDGSAAGAVATLLDVSKRELTESDLEQMEKLINEAKKEGR